MANDPREQLQKLVPIAAKALVEIATDPAHQDYKKLRTEITRRPEKFHSWANDPAVDAEVRAKLQALLDELSPRAR